MLGIHQAMPVDFYDLPLTAKSLDADTFQVFLRNNRNMKRRNFYMPDVNLFNRVMLETGINSFVVHACYAMNPSDANQHERCVKIIREDLSLMSYLVGTNYYVLHPGSSKDLSEKEALQNIAKVLYDVKDVIGNTRIALEFMAGAGTQMLNNPASILDMLYLCKDIPNVCICFDTCHVFAAGYDCTEALEMLAPVTGVLHLNNSCTVKGSRVDRHARIDRGYIPTEQLLEVAKQFSVKYPDRPIILETPGDTLVNDLCLVQNYLKKSF